MEQNIRKDTPSLESTEAKLKNYRTKRLQRALKQANGDKKKAYALLASEEFY